MQYKKYGGKWAIAATLLAIVLLVAPFAASAAPGIAPASSPTLVGRSIDFSYSDDPLWDGGRVSLNGKTVGTMRYASAIDGAVYEGFCVDPHLPGPEQTSIPYVINGTRNNLLQILRDGFPNNARMTEEGNYYFLGETYAWYITRAAAAYKAAGPGAALTSPHEILLNEVLILANGESTWNNPAHFKPDRVILINGQGEAASEGTANGSGMVVSGVFSVTNSHSANPVMFRWQAGTPAGTQIINAANNQVMATYPNLPSNNSFNTVNFKLAVPENADIESAGVDIVGIHDDFAGNVWSSRTNSNPEGYQEMVFYIPPMRASASITYEPFSAGRLRIVKTNVQGGPLSGAVFSITGPDSSMPMTVTVPASGWTSGLLAPGTYTVTETSPPSGYQLGASTTQTVTVIDSQTAPVAVTFSNPPTETTPPDPPSTSVRIQKIDALTRENIPGALMRLRGISSHQIATEDGQMWEIDNTGINISQVLTSGAATAVPDDVESTVQDGIWTLEGLPYGAYIVEEERAPANYSLLPQHTSYGFWLLPPNISIKVNQHESQAVVDIQVAINEMLEAAIAAAAANGTENPNIPALLEEIRQILSQMLAGMTLDVAFDIEEGSGANAVLITFENYPFGQIEAAKYDEVTGAPLAGAHFRIQGYFAEGNTNGMPIDRVQVTGSDGRAVFENLPAGQYTISEIEAPPGYQLDGTAFRSISLTWGQTASTAFYNRPKTFVEVIKVDGNDTSLLLDGARFRLSDPTSGETWEGVTSGGRARLGAGSGSFGNQLIAGRLYILTEIQAPNGYVLDPSPIEVIVAADNQLNTITVRNFRSPSLTIVKYDELTNGPLAGASFRLWRTEGGTWGETQVTGADGTITWTGLEPGIYSVQEIDEPYGYTRDAARKEIMLEGGDSKRLTFFNRPRPTLTILKRDQATGAPLPGAMFRVQQVDGVTVGEFVTDENGMIELSPRTGYLLGEHAYRITEVTPPDGYLLSGENTREVLLKWQEPTELIFENLPRPTLTIIKYDELTNEPLAGASFRLWRTEGETWSETQVTGADGRITWIGLDPGIYSVQEIDEPYGYFRDPARKEALLEGGDNKELLFFNRPRPTLTIFKRDQVTGEPLSGVMFRVHRLEGETIGDFLTDENGMIEISPRTGYLLGEHVYRVTEVQPPAEYLLSADNVRDVLLKWREPTELVFENLLKPTLIFIKTNGLTGRGISDATYRVEYENGNGGITNLGTYNTKCGLIVLPHVMPGWYILTETKPAPGYQLPTNPVQRIYLAPGQNSYTHAQTQVGLYVDQRTNPLNGARGMCGDCCGYMCSRLCAGNCGNPGGGNTAGSTGGAFGNMTITNGSGESLGTITAPTTPPTTGTPAAKPTLTAGPFIRNSNITATVTFTSSAAGRYYYAVVGAGAAEPYIATTGIGATCAAGSNTVTVYMTAGARDVYIKVKDADSNESVALKFSVPAYQEPSAPSQAPAQEPEQAPVPEPPQETAAPPASGGIVYLNPDFPFITITFGNT